MNTLAIEINDAELVIADQTGVHGKEPGYAALISGSIVTGMDAYSQARLNPRQTSNRFWDDLSMDSGSAGVDSVDSSAELAFAQLSSIWKRFGGSGMDAVLVVPGHYTREQLGLLLGLAQECKMPVRALVNAGVAASTQNYADHQLVYLDASLHRVSAAIIEQNDDACEKHEQGLSGVGLASLFDLWATRVAEIFVLQTRFDPFHRAETEQLVYDLLPGWLTKLQEEGESELSLSHDGKEHCVEVKREQLLGVVGGFCKALVQLSSKLRKPEVGMVVQLSHRLQQLPGITNEFQNLNNTHVVPMDIGAAALGMLKGLDGIVQDGDQVKLLKRLPWRGEVVQLNSQQTNKTATLNKDNEENSLSQPTHLVYRGVAYEVDGDSLYIGREAVEDCYSLILDKGQKGASQSHCEIIRKKGGLSLIDLSQSGTYVNEKKVSGEIDLYPADVIRIGSPGEELQVIALGECVGS